MSTGHLMDEHALPRRLSLKDRLSQELVRRMSGVSMEEERDGTVAGTTFNTLCNVMGAGVLSLPLAFYNSSVVVGIFLLLFSGFASAFAVYALVRGCDATGRYSYTEVLSFTLYPPRTFDEFCQEDHPHLPDNFSETEAGITATDELRMMHQRGEVRRRKLRRIITLLVEMMVFSNNYGALIIYARVISTSIPPVVESFLHGSGIVVAPTFWLIASGVLFFFLSCSRTMNELKWTSLLGFVTIFYIVVCAVVRFFTDYHNPTGNVNVVPRDRSEINWFHLGTGVFKTMSTFGVAFGYHFNVPYFYKELSDRRPATMMTTVGLAFPIIVGCYLLTGFYGYLTFGAEVADPAAGGDIVGNYSTHDVVLNIGRLGLFLHFACVYPILSVCARRGLHRVVMMLLTWAEHTKIMEAELGRLADYAEGRGPLGGQEVSLGALDVDVGAPETTTRVAIVVEALIIVTSTVSIAGVVSGISIVIDIIGTLFGLFLMLIGPGIIAWVNFGRSAFYNYDGYAVTYPSRARLGKVCAAIIFVSGVTFSGVGLGFLIKGHLSHN